MKKTLILAGAVLALSASIAAAEGINLSWNDCGANGQSSATFNCGSNSGAPFAMVASFVPPPGVNEYLGLSAQVDATSVGPLPDWWKHGTSQCRGTGGMTVSFDFTSGPFSCFDFFGGQAAGGFAYDVGFASPNRGRLRIQAAVPFDNRGPIDPGTEYYAFKVNLQRSKSTGAGNCPGCTEPMCVVLNTIQLFQPPEAANDPEISNPLNAQHVTWQAPVIPNCPQGTPSRNKSWGQVKSLYR